jgi:hypothetical protein
LPPAQQPACQRHLNNEDLFNNFSMISSQAQLVGGGPPTRNIEFALGRNTEQPPPSMMQQETNNVTARYNKNNGVPVGSNPVAIPPCGPGANSNTANLIA